ncbi:hypothetical protein BGX29_011429 [Mortierella sp. GBA35]|nr:hypothetical protein BGX29_011429 [Mortierella sp. GBA35]
MTPARISLLDLPLELMACLAHLLPEHSLLQLTLTNQALNEAFTPFLWKTIDLMDGYRETRLRQSTTGQEAFSNNVGSIRSVAWRASFSRCYIDAVCTYLRTLPIRQLIRADILEHHQWGRTRFPVPFPLIPLPPLLQLTRYKGFMADFDVRQETAHDLGLAHHDDHHHQVLWLLRLNSQTLTCLELRELNLDIPRVVRDLARTISQLPRLRSLRLSTYRNSTSPSDVPATLFFSCPDSLVDFELTHSSPVFRTGAALDPVKGDWDFYQGPLVLRQVAPPHLKSFRVSHMLSDVAVSILRPILQGCRALESLQLPELEWPFPRDINTVQAVRSLIKEIGMLCPSLTDLSFRDDIPDTPNSPGTPLLHVLRITEVFREQRLKSFRCIGHSGLSSDRTIACLARHSTTLRRIEFVDCDRVESRVVQAVLASCGALEVFRVRAYRYRDVCVPLELADAIEYQWACTRIRELEIVVRVQLAGYCPWYYADPSMAIWTEQDNQDWSNLGRFYTQIGSLTNLEVLNLKAVDEDWGTSPKDQYLYKRSPSMVSLPGLLALADPSCGLRGYLSTLSGLTRLRELRGSFAWTAWQAMARIREREVDWFVAHLPALELATFVDDGSINTNQISSLADLKERRPELRIGTERQYPVSQSSMTTGHCSVIHYSDSCFLVVLDVTDVVACTAPRSSFSVVNPDK